jgi:tRNA modification GTPase
VADTAGLRESAGEVERLGIEKSLQYAQEADILIVVLDRSVPFCQEDEAVARAAQGRPAVLVLNKADLPEKIRLPATFSRQFHSRVEVSALRDARLTSLRRAVFEAVLPESHLELEAAPLTNLRQADCVRRARRALGAAARALAGDLSEEFAAYDLKRALSAIGEITGETSTGDILEEIFATFCIGK